MSSRSVLLVAAALVAAACGVGVEPGSGDPVTDPAASGSLEVVQELECCYIEGSRSHVVLQTDGGQVVAENEFGPGPLIQPAMDAASLPAGTYLLQGWQRPCAAACPPQGGLDPATDRCDLEFDVAPGQDLEALVEVTPGEGCTITVGRELAQTTGDGAVHAFAAGTGQERWRVAIGGTMVELVAVGAGQAYVATAGHDEALHALELASGDVVWRHETATWWPPGGAVVAGDTLYTTVWDGTTLALDAATGHERWRAATPGESPKAPAVADDVVVVGTDTQGHLYGLDRATGEERWRQQLAGGIPAAPTVEAGNVYVTAYGGTDDGRLVALDAASGVARWEAALPGSVLGGAAAGAGAVYAGSGSIDTATGTLQAFDTATGAPRWSVTTDGSVYHTPVVADGLVLVADLADDGRASLYAFRAANGELVWTAPLPGEMRGTPTVHRGRVHVTAHPAHLLVLDVEDGTVIQRVDAPDLRGDVDDLTAPRTDGNVVVVGSS